MPGHAILLLVVLLVAAWLRFDGLTWGIPRPPHYRNFHQDERFALGLLFQMDPARLDLNPHYFINPSLHYYSLLGILTAARVFGLQYHLPVAGDSPFRPVNMPGSAYIAIFIVCRILAILESLACVLLIYLIGRQLYNPKTGLLASLLLAVSYPAVYQGHFFTTDGPALFYMLLSLFFIVRLFRRGRRPWSVLAPIGIGLAIGAKYLNVLLIIPYLYVLARGSTFVVRRAQSPGPRSSSTVHRLPIAQFARPLLLILGAFLVTTPYALLSTREFIAGDKSGFGGIFGAHGLLYYNDFPPNLLEPFTRTSLAALGGLGLALTALSLIVLIRRHRPQDILLLAFIIPFYALLVLKSSPALRHILPVLPFLFLGCAAAFSGARGKWLPLLVALTWFPFSQSAVRRMDRTDTRTQCEDWLDRSVTTETIAFRTYIPYWYTPGLDSFHLLRLEYDYEQLQQRKPEYLLLDEYEHPVTSRNQEPRAGNPEPATKRAFMAALARDTNYQLYQRFAEPFRFCGLTLHPYFPAIRNQEPGTTKQEWSFPDPEILIYRRTH